MSDLKLEEKVSEPILANKVKDWVKRYGPAEVAGTLSAYRGFFVATKFTDNPIMTAYAATMGENIGFYGITVIRDIVEDRKKAQKQGNTYEFKDSLCTTRNLLVEFGGAEYFDSIILRPLAMGSSIEFLGPKVGLGVGKLAADITFYVPTIISYELRKKHLS